MALKRNVEIAQGTRGARAAIHPPSATNIAIGAAGTRRDEAEPVRRVRWLFLFPVIGPRTFRKPASKGGVDPTTVGNPLTDLGGYRGMQQERGQAYDERANEAYDWGMGQRGKLGELGDRVTEQALDTSKTFGDWARRIAGLGRHLQACDAGADGLRPWLHHAGSHGGEPGWCNLTG